VLEQGVRIATDPDVGVPASMRDPSPYAGLVEEPSPRSVVAFVRSVAVLALDADAQVAWASQLMKNHVPLIDELAMEFDDGFRLVPSFIERGWLNEAALPVLTQLDERLEVMSGQHNADLWHAEALSSRAEWERVRGLARAALTLLG
jgi:hypothetical protein